MLLLDSVFINNGGGKVLLDYLVRELENRQLNVFYLFDARCKNSFVTIPAERKFFIEGNLLKRHRFYKNHKNSFSKVFCFGNIPPTIRLKATVYTYFHNVSLLSQPAAYKWKEAVIKKLKGRFVALFSGNSDYYLVQTEDVKTQLMEYLHIEENCCLVLPFFFIKSTANRKKKDAFVYISNGNSHKNHGTLLKAWGELAKLKLFPTLHLTITEHYGVLLKTIEQCVSNGLNIINHGYTDPCELYSECRYLIYPSLCESFGLGLIEAIEYNCNVLASDLPFVYEVIQPTATFDPLDPISISTTVASVLSGENINTSFSRVDNKIFNLLELIKE